VAVATWLVGKLRGRVEPTPNAIFFCAIMFSAWMGGWGPGILAALLSTLAVKFDDLSQPLRGLTFSANELPRLLFFLGTGMFISWLTGRQRRAEAALQSLNNELENKVMDRTAELRKTNDALKAEMSERQRAEADLRRTEADLAHVTRVTTVGELTASIAHEVNQPLTAIVNNANACLNLLDGGGKSLDEVRAALTEITEDGERAGAIIERIRALVKKSPPRLAPCDFRSVVRNVLALALNESTARGVAVRTELFETLPLIMGDEVQLQQVLLNLAMNGMEAMDDVEKTRRLLVIGARPDERDGKAGLTVDVRDSGAGLKAGDMDKIFEAFYSTKSDGLGMGLAISRSIIESHGGRLWATSNDGQGATFSFWLPTLERAAQ
jgi:C4-dicarboxylate-specific signal transduction histidine kinase